MKLHPPFEIGSNLCPAVRIGGAVLSLEPTGVRNNRLMWKWEIILPDGRTFSEADIGASPMHTDNAEGHRAAWGAFLNFLGACAEGRRYERVPGRESENSDLFPEAVGEWAEEFSDELSLLGCEIEEPDCKLIEDGGDDDGD